MRTLAALLLLLSAALTLKTTHVVATDVASKLDSQGGEGRLTIRATSAAGRPLAVRVRVRPSSPFAGERVFHESSGELTTGLAAGRYQIVVTHGPEWSIYEQTITVIPGAEQMLPAVLVREVDAEEFTPCDLHLHTSASPDSELTLRDRVATLRAEDVAFAVLTEHNHVAQATAEFAEAGIATLAGAEITTWDPEFGHFNAFPLHRAPRYKRTNVSELLRALRADASTFVQVNHPRLEHHIGYFELSGFARGTQSEEPFGFDGVEVWNGYELATSAAQHEVFVDWLSLLQRGQHVTATGSSDSHTAARAPFAGYPRTYVRVARKEAGQTERVLAALKAGSAFVSNGPIIDLTVEGHVPGQTLQRSANTRSLSLRVDIAAARWMELEEVEIWLGMQRVATLPVPPPELGARAHEAHVELELPIADARTVVATVRGKGSMRGLLGDTRARPYAFTNPVYLDAPR